MPMPANWVKRKSWRLSLSSSAVKRVRRPTARSLRVWIALKKKDTNEAIRQMTAANNLLDTWIGRFELGRAYLEAGAFTEA